MRLFAQTEERTQFNPALFTQCLWSLILLQSNNGKKKKNPLTERDREQDPDQLVKRIEKPFRDRHTHTRALEV